MVEVNIIIPHWKERYCGFSQSPSFILPNLEKAIYSVQPRVPVPIKA